MVLELKSVDLIMVCLWTKKYIYICFTTWLLLLSQKMEIQIILLSSSTY